MKFTENMLHLNISYPTFELPPKSRRPAPWARHGPYYVKTNDRTLQNHARTFISFIFSMVDKCDPVNSAQE
jgi:hypothetical protein